MRDKALGILLRESLSFGVDQLPVVLGTFGHGVKLGRVCLKSLALSCSFSGRKHGSDGDEIEFGQVQYEGSMRSSLRSSAGQASAPPAAAVTVAACCWAVAMMLRSMGMSSLPPACART
jgi:hypothetical protein